MTTTTLTPVDFGKRLNALIHQHGVSSADVAENTQCGLSNLRAYRKGTAFPKLDALIDIAIFFGVSVDHLVCTSDDARQPATVHVRGLFMGATLRPRQCATSARFAAVLVR